jgi:hypothetical protein
LLRGGDTGDNNMASNLSSKQAATPIQTSHSNKSSKVTQEVEGPPSAAEWVDLWNHSESLAEFCRVRGMTPASASARASYYRAKLKPHGVTLKSLGAKGRGRIDYEAIAQKIREDMEKNQR